MPEKLTRRTRSPGKLREGLHTKMGSKEDDVQGRATIKIILWGG